MACLNIEKLSRYLDHELSDVEKQKVETHLQECAHCNQELNLLKNIDDHTSLPLYDDPGKVYWNELPIRIIDKIGLGAEAQTKISVSWLEYIRNFFISLWQPNRLAFKLVGAAIILSFLYIVTQDIYKDSTSFKPQHEEENVLFRSQDSTYPKVATKTSAKKEETEEVPAEKLPQESDLVKPEKVASEIPGIEKKVPEPKIEIKQLVDAMQPEQKAVEREILPKAKEPVEEIAIPEQEEIPIVAERKTKKPIQTDKKEKEVVLSETPKEKTETTVTHEKAATAERQYAKRAAPQMGVTPSKPEKSKSFTKRRITDLLKGKKKLPGAQTQFMATQKQDEFQIASQRAARVHNFTAKEAIWLNFLKQHPDSPKRAQAKAELAMLYYENSTESKKAVQRAIQYFEKEKDDLVTALGLRRYSHFLSRLKGMRQKNDLYQKR